MNCYQEVGMSFLNLLVYIHLVVVIFGVLYMVWRVKRFLDQEEINEIRIKRDWPQAE